MKHSLFALLAASGCMSFPAMPMGSTTPAPAVAQAPSEPTSEPAPPSERTTERHESSSESRQERHTMNGREVRTAEPTPDGVASDRDINDTVRALKKIPMVDRTRELGNLIDGYYLTVDQVAVLLGAIPRPDHRSALDIVACSVVDPEHAGRITSVVGPSDASESVAILTQKCFTKFPGDRRPAGKVAQKAAPPPGAYRLPGED